MNSHCSAENFWCHYFYLRNGYWALTYISMLRRTGHVKFSTRVCIVSHVSSVAEAVPQHTYGGAGVEKMYSSYLFTTSAVDEGEWSASRPGRASPPRKGPPVPIVQKVGWTPELVWTQRLEEEISYLYRESNVDSPVVQSVARHCTDWTTPATNINMYGLIRLSAAFPILSSKVSGPGRLLPTSPFFYCLCDAVPSCPPRSFRLPSSRWDPWVSYGWPSLFGHSHHMPQPS
jgi:hypothetical protein